MEQDGALESPRLEGSCAGRLVGARRMFEDEHPLGAGVIRRAARRIDGARCGGRALNAWRAVRTDRRGSVRSMDLRGTASALQLEQRAASADDHRSAALFP